jgi:hypothetical protein
MYHMVHLYAATLLDFSWPWLQTSLGNLGSLIWLWPYSIILDQALKVFLG